MLITAGLPRILLKLTLEVMQNMTFADMAA